MAITAPETHPFDPKQPFSRAQARAAGIGLKTLLSSRFQKVFYDCYVSSNVPLTTKLRAKAALGTAVTRFRNLPVTTPEQTFLDLATGLDLVALVVLGDSLIRAGRTSSAVLRDAATAWRSRGAKLARRAARYVRDGVDSGMETRLRMLLVLAGLPGPEVNFILRHPDGSWWMRFDMCYPSLKLIIEYDGRQHAEDSNQWLHDLRRREALDRMGWRVIVITKHDYYETPEDVLIRVRDALIERGMVGVRRRFKPEWVRHVIGA